MDGDGVSPPLTKYKIKIVDTVTDESRDDSTQKTYKHTPNKPQTTANALHRHTIRYPVRYYRSRNHRSQL